MTPKERLKRCYFNEELDRPAVYSRTSFPANDPSYDGLKNYLHAHTELKLKWDGTALEADDPTDSYTEPYSEDFSRQDLVGDHHDHKKRDHHAPGQVVLRHLCGMGDVARVVSPPS